MVLWAVLGWGALAAPAEADAGRDADNDRVRPADEGSPDGLYRELRDDEGMPVLSYPGRTPMSTEGDPGVRPMSHFTILLINTISGFTLWAAGSALTALVVCEDWSVWARELFRRSACGTVPIMVGGLFLWGAVTGAASYTHGAAYNGGRLEAWALVGLGTLLGAGLAGVVWAATEERWAVASASIALPLVGALSFAELAAHAGATDAHKEPFTRAPVGFTVTGSGVTAVLRGSF